MSFHVRLSDGETHTIPPPPLGTLLADVLWDTFGVPPESQRLVDRNQQVITQIPGEGSVVYLLEGASTPDPMDIAIDRERVPALEALLRRGIATYGEVVLAILTRAPNRGEEAPLDTLFLRLLRSFRRQLPPNSDAETAFMTRFGQLAGMGVVLNPTRVRALIRQGMNPLPFLAYLRDEAYTALIEAGLNFYTPGYTRLFARWNDAFHVRVLFYRALHTAGRSAVFAWLRREGRVLPYIIEAFQGRYFQNYDPNAARNPSHSFPESPESLYGEGTGSSTTVLLLGILLQPEVPLTRTTITVATGEGTPLLIIVASPGNTLGQVRRHLPGRGTLIFFGSELTQPDTATLQEIGMGFGEYEVNFHPEE